MKMNVQPVSWAEVRSQWRGVFFCASGYLLVRRDLCFIIGES
jgi:hypothetical protein